MATAPENPCRWGHPELGLMANITTLLDVNTVLRCPRCKNFLSFEDAVRNDERMRWAAKFDEAAAWHRADAAGPLRVRQGAAALGFEMAAEEMREATP